jgi:eukaryotic-like serine/threonine-protein kinase
MRSTSSPSEINKSLLREGELLAGRYKIERCLGSGGMATVYRAMHLGLEQPVAIKVVTAALRDVPGVAARFMREARAATRLKGEHVVRVFDVGKTDEGSPFLVMELLEGKDLAELFEDRFQPTIEEAVDLTLQACEALAEVHGLGIVHRDLKPANLYVVRGADGLQCLKLIDFGISRFDAPLTGVDAMAITNPEVVMGSPRYMPPEQMESAAAVDSRSDIWGLGAILYEMLAGRAPFDGESLFDIYAATVRSPPPPPSRTRPDVPRGLDDVILRCLEVDPNQRYADVADLALALAPFGDDRAMARAESIARVLEASRVRGNGGEIHGKPRVDLSPSARMRRRKERARRRRVVIGALLTVVIGVGAASARPLARRFMLVPSVSVSGAAAATPNIVLRETTPAPAPTAAPTPPTVSAEPVRVPARVADAVPPRPRTVLTRAVPAPEPTVDVAETPDPPAPASSNEPSRSDSLFEERK